MKKLIYVMLAVVFFSSFSEVSAQLEKYQTTFIYNFTRSIQWPNLHQETEFVIGILGKNHPLFHELKVSMDNRTAGGRPIKLVEFSSSAEIENCHILFVPNNHLRQMKQVTEILKSKPTLIVTESQGRTPVGSLINLFVENERMKFNLDEELAKDKKLMVSTQLRNYAKN